MIVVMPLPDETVYSHRERMAWINLRPSFDQVLDVLRGSEAKRPSPRFIDDATIVTASACGMTHDDYINRHSLAPIYRPELRKYLGRRSENWEFNKGRFDKLSAWNFGSDVRRCPACEREDSRDFGIVYLHRQHYIPGIDVCPAHGSPILQCKNQRIVNWRSAKKIDHTPLSRNLLAANSAPVIQRYQNACLQILKSSQTSSRLQMLQAVTARINELGIERTLGRRTTHVMDYWINCLPNEWRNAHLIVKEKGRRSLRTLPSERGYYAILMLCALYESVDEVLLAVLGIWIIFEVPNNSQALPSGSEICDVMIIFIGGAL